MASQIKGLIDTNIAIDLLKGYSPAVEWFKAHHPGLGMSFVCQAELLVGAREIRGNLSRPIYDKTLQFNRQFIAVEELDLRWAFDRFQEHWLSRQIPFPDCLIASAAHLLDVPLFSRDKHIALLLPKRHVIPY